jgi:hypothetical protein
MKNTEQHGLTIRADSIVVTDLSNVIKTFILFNPDYETIQSFRDLEFGQVIKGLVLKDYLSGGDDIDVRIDAHLYQFCSADVIDPRKDHTHMLVLKIL